MRLTALTLLGAGLLLFAVEPASARRINCGPGMNSDGYRCFPISQRHEYRGYRGAYGYQPRYYQRDYYYQPPRRARGGGCYGPTGIYDPRGC